MYLGAEEPGGLGLAMPETRRGTHTVLCHLPSPFFSPNTGELSVHKVFSFSTGVSSISALSS